MQLLLYIRDYYGVVSSRVRENTWKPVSSGGSESGSSITLTDSLTKMLRPVPVTLRSTGVESSVSKRRMFPPGDTTMDSLNWKSATCHSGLLMPLNQHRKWGSFTARGDYPDYQGEIALLLHHGAKEDCVWSPRDPLGHLLVLPYPTVKVNVKPQQPKKAEWLKIKVWVTPLCKEPRAVAENKVNMGQALE